MPKHRLVTDVFLENPSNASRFVGRRDEHQLTHIALRAMWGGMSHEA